MRKGMKKEWISPSSQASNETLKDFVPTVEGLLG